MTDRIPIFLIVASLTTLATGTTVVDAAPKPVATHADVAYGSSPHQLMDVYLPSTAKGPFPVLIWYGGIWQPSKHVPDLNRFVPKGIAVIGVETRTLIDGMQERASPPVSYVMNDACRAVQFVRLNAPKWNIDPQRIAVGGGSQGLLACEAYARLCARSSRCRLERSCRADVITRYLRGRLSESADDRSGAHAEVGSRRQMGSAGARLQFRGVAEAPRGIATFNQGMVTGRPAPQTLSTDLF